MLLHDDIMTYGEAEPGPLSGRLGRKERIEHLVFNVSWNTSSVVPDSDFHPVAKASR